MRKDLRGVTAEKVLGSALEVKHKLDEHITDRLDLDMSIGEWELSQRFPLDYDKNVNGIKHIVVRDLDQEYRYSVIDGELKSKGVF